MNTLVTLTGLVLGSYLLSAGSLQAAEASVDACVSSSGRIVYVQEEGEDCPRGHSTVTLEVEGPQGAAGQRGEKGETGPAGEPGVAGEQGPQGAPGREGLEGPQGPAGPAGTDGMDAVDGPPGTAGQPGEEGADRPAQTTALCSLYQDLSDRNLIGELTVPDYCPEPPTSCPSPPSTPGYVSSCRLLGVSQICTPTACEVGYSGFPSGNRRCVAGVITDSYSGCVNDNPIDPDPEPIEDCDLNFSQEGYQVSCTGNVQSSFCSASACAVGYQADDADDPKGFAQCVDGINTGSISGCSPSVP